MASLRRAWWWSGAVPALLTAAAWLTQVLVSDELPGWAHWALVVGGALSALLAFLLPARQASQERQGRIEAEDLAKKAVAAYKVQIHDMLIPLSIGLNDVISASNRNRREAQRELLRMVVDLAAEYLGSDRTRACFYELDATTAAPTRILKRKSWKGRNKEPRDCFKEGTPEGNFTFQVVDTSNPELVPDVDNANLQGWTSGSTRYKTFICVAVYAGDRVFGVLTLDSLKVGDLKEDDLELMRLFAQLLAGAFAVGS